MATQEKEAVLVPGLDFGQYKEMAGINSSLLRDVMAVGARLAVHGKPKEETKAMQLGSAIHCAALEPDEYPNRYLSWDEEEALAGAVTVDGDLSKSPRSTKAYKEHLAKAEAEALKDGKILLRKVEYDVCKRAAQRAMDLMPGNLYTELTAFWPLWEIGCVDRGKARIDAIDFTNGILYDIKTTDDIGEWEPRLHKNRYHCQMAWYNEALRNTSEVEIAKHRWIIVSTDGTEATFLDLEPEDLECGRRECKRALDELVRFDTGDSSGSRFERKSTKYRLPAFYKEYGA